MIAMRRMVSFFENYLKTIKLKYAYADLFLAGDFNTRLKDFLDFIPDDNLDFIFGDIPYNGDNFSL